MSLKAALQPDFLFHFEMLRLGIAFFLIICTLLISPPFSDFLYIPSRGVAPVANSICLLVDDSKRVPL